MQVKGKQKAVPIYELLGRSGEVDASSIAYAQAFSRAVDEFQQREFGQAHAAFVSCFAERPQDRGATAYAAEAERFVAAPPGADWNGALELVEK